MGISSREPPATPEAPHAARVLRKERMSADGKSTATPTVFAAASVITAIVIAAPSMLIVAPRGMETEYISRSSPNFSHRDILTGMLAAELRVKKAVRPDFNRQRHTSG